MFSWLLTNKAMLLLCHSFSTKLNTEPSWTELSVVVLLCWSALWVYPALIFHQISWPQRLLVCCLRMWIFGSERKDSPHSGSRQTGRARPFVRIKGRGKINLLQIFIHLPSVSRISSWARIHHLNTAVTRPGINNHPSVTHHTSHYWEQGRGVTTWLQQTVARGAWNGGREGGQWVTDWLADCLVTNGVLTAASPLRSHLRSAPSPGGAQVWEWHPGDRTSWPASDLVT